MAIIRRISWRGMVFFVLSLFIVSFAAACGGDSTARPERNNQAATSAAPSGGEAADATAAPADSANAPAASTAVTSAAQPAASAPGRIQIAVVPGAMQATMQKLVDAFEAENPGTTVEVIQEPEGAAFEALIAAGNQPDIITGSFGAMPAKYASQEAIIPLEALPGAQELFARFDERTVQQDFGHNYYVPLGADVTMMIYNKELFQEAGLDPEQPPQTFADFIAAAEKIQALPARQDGSKVYGTVFWNDALTFGGWYWNMLQPIYLNANQNQCTLLNRLGTDVEFDKPECGMNTFFDFTKQAQQYAPPTMEPKFFSRAVGMWPQYGYSWEPNLREATERPMVIGEDVGIAPVPVPEAGNSSYTTLGGRSLMIMKTTPERQELAWKFVTSLMADENNLEFIKELGYLPTVTTLQSDPYFTEPARKPFVDALETAVYPQSLANFEQAANAVLATYQETVVDNKGTPEEAVQTAAQRAREAIQQ